jgi:hypothetical protein
MANISTIYGDMDELVLEKKTGVQDSIGECTTWIEYWYNGELVHRSVQVNLKEGTTSSIQAITF